MVEKNERIAKFAAAINDDADEWCKKIEAELESATASALEKERAELESSAKRKIKLETSKLQEASNRILAEKSAEKRAGLTKKRAELTDNIFAKAEAKLLEFAGTAAYDEFCKKSLLKIAELLKNGVLTVYIKEADSNKSEFINKIIGEECVIKIDNSIKIGGFKAKNENGTLFVDDTLDSRLSAQREWFLENCGMSVIM